MKWAPKTPTVLACVKRWNAVRACTAQISILEQIHKRLGTASTAQARKLGRSKKVRSAERTIVALHDLDMAFLHFIYMLYYWRQNRRQADSSWCLDASPLIWA